MAQPLSFVPNGSSPSFCLPSIVSGLPVLLLLPPSVALTKHFLNSSSCLTETVREGKTKVLLKAEVGEERENGDVVDFKHITSGSGKEQRKVNNVTSQQLGL